jgi:hypothetical protein
MLCGCHRPWGSITMQKKEKGIIRLTRVLAVRRGFFKTDPEQYSFTDCSFFNDVFGLCETYEPVMQFRANRLVVLHSGTSNKQSLHISALFNRPAWIS